MAVTVSPAQAAAEPTPQLRFEVVAAGPVEPAATPTLRLRLRVEAAGARVRSILLHTQVQLAARARRYDEEEQARLADLFGGAERWGTTLRSLAWLAHTQVVPGFDDCSEVELALPCTYDFEVVAARYLQALRGGAIPLELLFSGTVFYAASDGRLQTAQIAWDREARYDLPLAVWRATMDRHFPDSAWLRLPSDSFDRLALYRTRRGLLSWEATIDALLSAAEAGS